MNKDYWETSVTDLPKDGSVLDIIVTDNPVDEPLGMLSGFVLNRKIMTPRGVFSDKLMDVTNSVKKWHKVPNILWKNNKLYWDDQDDY